jgi:(+)-trans-carveol dehydrogenase/(-)-trans-carveol dehydrogenase
MPGRVDGLVAFITGAARGQGRSHAVRLAEEGADIIAIDACSTMPDRGYEFPTGEDLAETARLVEKTGRRIVTRQVDVRDLAGLQSAVDDGVAVLGRLDVISANAGIGTRYDRAHEMSEEEWQLMLDINLTGVWHTCKVGVPHILAGGRGGSIILTGSTASQHGLLNLANYVAAKHGVIGLMKTMANELGPEGVRVNAVLPTQVNTPMLVNPKTIRLFVPGVAEPTIEEFAAASQTTGTLPLPWAEPADISNAVLFLASAESRCITGVALPVDNGALAKYTPPAVVPRCAERSPVAVSHHAPDHPALAHVGVGLGDLVDGVALGDQLVQLEVPLVVESRQPRDVVVTVAPAQ